MREISPELDELYIASFSVVDLCGEHYLAPAGVVFGKTTDEAEKQAIDRWPNLPALTLIPWGNVPPEIRMLALEEDRALAPVSFILPIRVLAL